WFYLGVRNGVNIPSEVPGDMPNSRPRRGGKSSPSGSNRIFSLVDLQVQGKCDHGAI
ncbi:hypothetical protein STEG23_026104, partial [Scotinomys teguina]